ncbi:FAD-binding oxidoreductase [Streptomyces sp. NRRL B-24572]|uniref:NAD(P)/FAD-dependent oxidoreductase n=1 Tax=Streptomyces sp. NRRL B-24572 TaxID=1962156 RepID=UPI000A38B3EF|nr:FAD-dependent oxidoreductase [Streptomyces sp. NRRL B-24572]
MSLSGLLTAKGLTVLREEATRLERAAQRRDFAMECMDGSPRHMTTLGGHVIAQASRLVPELYADPDLLALVSGLIEETALPVPDPVERHVLNILHREGDTHGAHTDDYPYALVIFLEAPESPETGGLLEYVANAVSLRDLTARPARTAHHRAGDAYLLRSDTTAHRVTPLARAGERRTVLNFAYTMPGSVPQPTRRRVGCTREAPDARHVAERSAEPAHRGGKWWSGVLPGSPGAPLGDGSLPSVSASGHPRRRSRRSMRSIVVHHAEAVVVGAGMFGSAAAKYLSRAGADVVLIGPEEPASGTTARQLPEYGAHQDESRIARCLGWDRFWGTVDTRSTGRYRDIEAESGIGFFHECGSLALAATSLGDRTEGMLAAARDDDVGVERLSPAEMRREFPELCPPPITGGVEALLERKNAGYINPRRLVRAQLELATASGARLLRGSVTSVRRDEKAGLWHVRGDDPAGCAPFLVAAERVLVAAGALINHTAALPPGRPLDLQVFTEPNLLFEVDASQRERLQGLPTVVTIDPTDSGDANMSTYLLPPVRYPDGRWYLRIGPAMQPLVKELRTAREMLAWCTRQKVRPEQSGFLLRMMRTLLPGLEPVSVREACCVVDKTPSRYPYIGPLDDDGLSVVVGGNGHGARGSDEIGRLASTVVLGRPWDFPLPQQAFAPRTAIAERSDRPCYLKPPFGLC